MTEGLRRHVPVIAVVSLLGIAIGAFALVSVLNNAPALSVESFSLYIIVIPCALMLVCSLAIMASASEINRQLFLVVAGICFASGIVSMVVTSIWLADPAVASALLANSPDGTTVTPPANAPIPRNVTSTGPA